MNSQVGRQFSPIAAWPVHFLRYRFRRAKFASPSVSLLVFATCSPNPGSRWLELADVVEEEAKMHSDLILLRPQQVASEIFDAYINTETPVIGFLVDSTYYLHAVRALFASANGTAQHHPA